MKILMQVLLLGCLLVVSCGNPHVVEDPKRDDIVNGNDPINPGPNDPPKPPPRPQKVVINLDARPVEGDDLSGLKIPYKKWLVKTINLGENRKGKWCAKNFKNECVKNRQVQFSFDLDEVPYLLDGDYRVVKANLKGSFYSIGKNYKTELLCLLNINRCSGRSIIRIPKFGMSFLVKMLWWDKKFWKDGHDKVVINDWFHTQMMSTWDDEEKLYLMEDWSLPLSSLFGMRSEHLTELFQSERPLTFTVTDDTYVKDLSIELVLEEVL